MTQQQTLIDTKILQNTWKFIQIQMKQFDVWFGLCGLVLIFGLLFSCIVVLAIAAIISVLVVVSPIILITVGGTLSVIIALCAAILGIGLFGKIWLWGFGFFNAIAVNALDAAHSRPLRRFQNRITGLMYVMGPMVYFLIICMGLSFLIIPGIVFAVRLSLARYVMLDQGTGIWSSLMTSWDMTRGNFFTLLALYAVLFVLYLIPFAFLIDLFFPVSNLCMAAVYVQLQQRQLTASIVSV